MPPDEAFPTQCPPSLHHCMSVNCRNCSERCLTDYDDRHYKSDIIVNAEEHIMSTDIYLVFNLKRVKKKPPKLVFGGDDLLMLAVICESYWKIRNGWDCLKNNESQYPPIPCNESLPQRGTECNRPCAANTTVLS